MILVCEPDVPIHEKLIRIYVVRNRMVESIVLKILGFKNKEIVHQKEQEYLTI
ncbi:MAG: hypothetical protein IPM92_03265 [Saprospiraceae bacterium]|nr:hypothetical protein [Saprospiraceae bacterium]